MNRFPTNGTPSNGLELLQTEWKSLSEENMDIVRSDHGVLEDIPVLLSEVLEVRGRSLEEAELWSLLCESVKSIQDLFLFDRRRVHDDSLVLITPDVLHCTNRGTVGFIGCSIDSIQKDDHASSKRSCPCSHRDNQFEKVLIHSLGQTLTYASEFNSDGTIPQRLSSILSSTLRAMSYPDISLRINLLRILEVAAAHAHTFTCGKPFSFYIAALYKEVLGNSHEHNIGHPHQNGDGKSRDLCERMVQIPRSNPDGISSTDHSSEGSQSTATACSREGSMIGLNARGRLGSQNTVCTDDGRDGDNNTNFRTASRTDFPNIDYAIDETHPRYRLECERSPKSSDSLHNKDELLSEEIQMESDKMSSEELVLALSKLERLIEQRLTCEEDNFEADEHGMTLNEPFSVKSIVTVNEELLEQHRLKKMLALDVTLPAIVTPASDLISNSDTYEKEKLTSNLTATDVVTKVKSSQCKIPSHSESCSTSANSSNFNNTIPPRSRNSYSSGGVPFANQVICDSVPSSTENFKDSSSINTCPLYSLEYYPELAIHRQPKNMIGPEFIVQSCKPSVPIRLAMITDKSGNRAKAGATKRVVVVLLNGQKLEMTCNPNKTRAKHVFQAAVQYLSLAQKFMFGLAYAIDEEFVFMEPETKLSKMPSSSWKNGVNSGKPVLSSYTLYFRIKFYISNNFSRDKNLKHLHYLQLRRDILERRIWCTVDLALHLGALSLQAEFGNYLEDILRTEYFIIDHYLPTLAIPQLGGKYAKAELIRLHSTYRDVSEELAEEGFVSLVQELPDYGFHFHSVQQDKKIPLSTVWLGVCSKGLYILDKYDQNLDARKVLQRYNWVEVKRISYDKRHFYLGIHSWSTNTYRDMKYKFYNTDKKGRYLFHLAVSHHRLHMMMRDRSLDTTSYVPSCQTITGYDEQSEAGSSDSMFDDREVAYEFPTRADSLQELKVSSSSAIDAKRRESLPSCMFRPSLLSSGSLSSLLPNECDKAFVIEADVECEPNSLHLLADETVSDSLAERFANLEGSPERHLTRIKIARPEKARGWFGFTVGNRSDGDQGIYIEGLSIGLAYTEGSLRLGDRIFGINGRSVQGMAYDDVLDLIRQSENTVDLIVSRNSQFEKLDLSTVCEEDLAEDGGSPSRSICNVENLKLDAKVESNKVIVEVIVHETVSQQDEKESYLNECSTTPAWPAVTALKENSRRNSLGVLSPAKPPRKKNALQRKASLAENSKQANDGSFEQNSSTFPKPTPKNRPPKPPRRSLLLKAKQEETAAAAESAENCADISCALAGDKANTCTNIGQLQQFRPIPAPRTKLPVLEKIITIPCDQNLSECLPHLVQCQKPSCSPITSDGNAFIIGEVPKYDGCLIVKPNLEECVSAISVTVEDSSTPLSSSNVKSESQSSVIGSGTKSLSCHNLSTMDLSDKQVWTVIPVHNDYFSADHRLLQYQCFGQSSSTKCSTSTMDVKLPCERSCHESQPQDVGSDPKSVKSRTKDFLTSSDGEESAFQDSSETLLRDVFFVDKAVLDQALKPGDQYHVVLEKTHRNLGLNITGGIDSSVPSGNISVKSIIPGGAADIDGRIRVGDVILQVSGTSLVDVSHQQAVNALRNCSQLAHLTLQRGPSKTTRIRLRSAPTPTTKPLGIGFAEEGGSGGRSSSAMGASAICSQPQATDNSSQKSIIVYSLPNKDGKSVVREKDEPLFCHHHRHQGYNGENHRHHHHKNNRKSKVVGCTSLDEYFSRNQTKNKSSASNLREVGVSDVKPTSNRQKSENLIRVGGEKPAKRNDDEPYKTTISINSEEDSSFGSVEKSTRKTCKGTKSRSTRDSLDGRTVRPKVLVNNSIPEIIRLHVSYQDGSDKTPLESRGNSAMDVECSHQSCSVPSSGYSSISSRIPLSRTELPAALMPSSATGSTISSGCSSLSGTLHSSRTASPIAQFTQSPKVMHAKDGETPHQDCPDRTRSKSGQYSFSAVSSEGDARDAAGLHDTESWKLRKCAETLLASGSRNSGRSFCKDARKSKYEGAFKPDEDRSTSPANGSVSSTPSRQSSRRKETDARSSKRRSKRRSKTDPGFDATDNNCRYEDECPNDDVDGNILSEDPPHKAFTFITAENTFDVELEKNSRGFGLRLCGGWDTNPADPLTRLIRIKTMYPLQPAMESGKLEVGDVLLAVNRRPLTGLLHFEALEVLRMASSKVVLTVCRPEPGILPSLPQSNGALGTAVNGSNRDCYSPATQPAGPTYTEFDLSLVKVGGSLGFTLVKMDGQNAGHYIKALVKEPALTDGTLSPGDKIILVNGVDISEMTHAEAISFLRNSPEEVSLCVWREVRPIQSPMSPLSPSVPFADEVDRVKRPKPRLRKEALDMLSDKARRRSELSSKGSSSPKVSPMVRRKERRGLGSSSGDSGINNSASPPESHLSGEATEENVLLKAPVNSPCEELCQTSPLGGSAENDALDSQFVAGTCQYVKLPNSRTSAPMDIPNVAGVARTPSSVCSSNVGSCADSPSADLIGRPQRPSFLDIHSCSPSPRKQLYNSGLLMPPPLRGSRKGASSPVPSDNSGDSDAADADSTSLRCLDSFAITDEDCLTTVTSTSEDCSWSTSPATRNDSHGPARGLLKWRGATLASQENLSELEEEVPEYDNHRMVFENDMKHQGSEVINVELERGWNSRLGFTVARKEPAGDDLAPYIKVVFPGSIAAQDGKLRVGDKLVKVNGTSVVKMTVEEVIDYLRKTKGIINLTVERSVDNISKQLVKVSGENVATMTRSQSHQEELLNNDVSALNAKNNNMSSTNNPQTRRVKPEAKRSPPRHNKNENFAGLSSSRGYTCI